MSPDQVKYDWMMTSSETELSFVATSDSTNVSNYTAWKWQLEKKNHDLAPELAAYTLTRSFSYASHQCGRDSLTPNCHIYTVAGGSQYYGHLRPTPEGSVRWYARRASSMCMCMSPRARWKMVHRSYLYMLSVSVMQAGVTWPYIYGNLESENCGHPGGLRSWNSALGCRLQVPGARSWFIFSSCHFQAV